MARGRIASSNGGILGSGIFGFFGSTVNCNSNDNSYYCNIMKAFNVMVVVLIVLYILYFAYLYLTKTKR